MLIYKLLTSEEWTDLQAQGETLGAPIDLRDGYVHFSTGAQVAVTAAKHFTGQPGLWLLAIEADRLGPALKWEPSRSGDLFPHLYAPLRLADVVRSEPLALGPDGRHVFPDGIAQG